MSTIVQSSQGGPSTEEEGQLVVALPEPGLSMTQDAEWCVVQIEDEWRQIRFHDYDELFGVPGLYEKVLYDVLKCDSPRTVRSLLEAELAAVDASPKSLRVLDLGAGNGMVGEELADMGVGHLVGADIISEAAEATDRDRPGIYDDYCVVDMTNLTDAQRRELERHRLNTLTCVAALGFGDIPPRAFSESFNLISTGGWVAFNIKEDFLSDKDPSGFSKMIRRMLDDGVLELRREKRYRHRLATNGDPLFYTALIGEKKRDIPDAMVP